MRREQTREGGYEVHVTVVLNRGGQGLDLASGGDQAEVVA